MSVQWLAWAFEHAEETGGARLVLLSLANHADEAGTCWPSIDTVCREARLSRRRVEHALRQLVKAGTVVREVNAGPMRGHGGYRTNLYRLVRDAARLSTAPEGSAPAETSGPTDVAPAETSGPVESGAAVSSTSGPEESSYEARKDRPGKPSVEPSREPSKPKPSSTALAVVTELSPAHPDTDPVSAVFDAWRTATGKHRARLDPKRQRRIQTALRDYPLEDVLDAVRGWRNSPFHCGDNTDGKVYNELELLLRDAQHIEQFRDLERHEPEMQARPAPRQPKGLSAVQRALERRGLA